LYGFGELIMHRVLLPFHALLIEEDGQTLGEYALILLLIAVAAVAAVTLFGTQLTALYNQIVAGLP